LTLLENGKTTSLGTACYEQVALFNKCNEMDSFWEDHSMAATPKTLDRLRNFSKEEPLFITTL
jgi:hypothetical protein